MSIVFQCWGAEGYQLWVIQESKKLHRDVKSAASNSTNHSEDHYDKCDAATALGNGSSSSDEAFFPKRHSVPTSNSNRVHRETERDFIQVQFAKSALTMNPCTVCMSSFILTRCRDTFSE